MRLQIKIQNQLVDSARNSIRDVRPIGASNMEILTIMYYAGHILSSYVGHSVIDIFRVNGPLIERLDMN